VFRLSIARLVKRVLGEYNGGQFLRDAFMHAFTLKHGLFAVSRLFFNEVLPLRNLKVNLSGQRRVPVGEPVYLRFDDEQRQKSQCRCHRSSYSSAVDAK